MKIYTEVKMIEISKIAPYFNNPRSNEKVVRALMEIIPKVGFNVPIFVDKNFVIIKGHSRYNAAKNLGMTELPCIISENTDAQNNADRVYDNAVQDLGDWNYERLSMELRNIDFKIPEIEFDMKALQAYGADIGDGWQTELTEKDLSRAFSIVDRESEGHSVRLLAIVCQKCGSDVLISLEDVQHLDNLKKQDEKDRNV